MKPDPETHAVERTALAWLRTGLAAAGTAAVFLTHALIHKHTAVASLIATAVVLGIVAISTVRHHALARGHWQYGGKPIVLTTLTMVAIVLLSAGIDVANLGT
ncbi:DUF202 domain-containing protein [Mycobacteroides saopaulense]|uniref:DUF202 domain-containing protein n=1 Tax=Mycobacteroides saopaulense TaxID=1578165 RepID=A0ABX3BZ74_9MYCO|nr:DUF202 domain-containing protein [Mycobacteroides saopaulense]OHT81519.1 hypothetical protein BKG68_21470 [Mycobacteroides saopaulense]OHU09047.1 hypothetical protein BKG73_13430 [Mycobacteroides saopaulense]